MSEDSASSWNKCKGASFGRRQNQDRKMTSAIGSDKSIVTTTTMSGLHPSTVATMAISKPRSWCLNLLNLKSAHSSSFAASESSSLNSITDTSQRSESRSSAVKQTLTNTSVVTTTTNSTNKRSKQKQTTRKKQSLLKSNDSRQNVIEGFCSWEHPERIVLNLVPDIELPERFAELSSSMEQRWKERIPEYIIIKIKLRGHFNDDDSVSSIEIDDIPITPNARTRYPNKQKPVPTLPERNHQDFNHSCINTKNKDISSSNSTATRDCRGAARRVESSSLRLARSTNYINNNNSSFSSSGIEQSDDHADLFAYFNRPVNIDDEEEHLLNFALERSRSEYRSNSTQGFLKTSSTNLPDHSRTTEKSRIFENLDNYKKIPNKNSNSSIIVTERKSIQDALDNNDEEERLVELALERSLQEVMTPSKYWKQQQYQNRLVGARQFIPPFTLNVENHSERMNTGLGCVPSAIPQKYFLPSRSSSSVIGLNSDGDILSEQEMINEALHRSLHNVR